jgi:hypothetical protein
MNLATKQTPTSPPQIFATRQQVTAALERSALKARLLAQQIGTELVQRPQSVPATKHTG